MSEEKELYMDIIVRLNQAHIRDMAELYQQINSAQRSSVQTQEATEAKTEDITTSYADLYASHNRQATTLYSLRSMMDMFAYKYMSGETFASITDGFAYILEQYKQVLSTEGVFDEVAQTNYHQLIQIIDKFFANKARINKEKHVPFTLDKDNNEIQLARLQKALTYTKLVDQKTLSQESYTALFKLLTTAGLIKGHSEMTAHKVVYVDKYIPTLLKQYNLLVEQKERAVTEKQDIQNTHNQTAARLLKLTQDITALLDAANIPKTNSNGQAFELLDRLRDCINSHPFLVADVKYLKEQVELLSNQVKECDCDVTRLNNQLLQESLDKVGAPKFPDSAHVRVGLLLKEYMQLKTDNNCILAALNSNSIPKLAHNNSALSLKDRVRVGVSVYQLFMEMTDMLHHIFITCAIPSVNQQGSMLSDRLRLQLLSNKIASMPEDKAIADLRETFELDAEDFTNTQALHRACQIHKEKTAKLREITNQEAALKDELRHVKAELQNLKKAKSKAKKTA